MQREKTLEETYDSCLTDGFILITDANPDKARQLMDDAKTSFNSANILAKSISKDSKEWQNVYSLNYEGLRMLAESLLLFDGITSSDEKSIFAALCVKHPDLELDWYFFEKIRTKISDEDSLEITNKNWKEIELQMKVYVLALTKEAEKKLS
jgi:hypothetical protein